MKYCHLSEVIYPIGKYLCLVLLMENSNLDELSNKDYISTIKKTLEQQLYSDFREDYNFPKAVCRSLVDMFSQYSDLYFSSQRKEGQIVYHATSITTPVGTPTEEMKLVPVKLTIYSHEDISIASEKSQNELLLHRIGRIANEAYNQGALLTQSDIAIILGESTRTIGRYIQSLELRGINIPTRGKLKDIGPGISHKTQIVELYLKGDEYTDIERKTKHTGESIMRYIKDFSRVLYFKEDNYSVNDIRILTGLSNKIIGQYLELIESCSGAEYQDRLDHIRSIFRKKNIESINQTIKNQMKSKKE